MTIPENIREKIDRLYRNQYLGAEEIRSLETWLEQMKTDPQTESWLSANWELATDTQVAISFEEIQARIKRQLQASKADQIRHILVWVQRVAAVLILPLLILSVWLLLNRQAASVMTLVTAKGEHAHVVLPDGSEVWLNVDSKLQYFTDYNKNNRTLKIKGEAFFKVAKGNKYPFTVDAKRFQVKAVGTAFSISAYDDDTKASAFLKEGVVELNYFPEGSKEQSLRMNPGERATIIPKQKSIIISKANAEKSIKWSEGELYFENEPFDQVFRKVERWYDVKIQYKLSEYNNETLTVALKKGESIDRLFQIIDKAIGIQITKKGEGEEYIINRK